ncbi:LysR family transcriptional regulator [Streptomyces sp. NPDC001549]|uniref:LysR family transcriptional regulator n=1 Tax=Streptomyces sp. NPDC001549 TaxID=3364586 RepID=UPI003682CB0F
MIDVQRLRVLRAVAEHGSFNRAAGALLLTPSAVSQHIAALERTVGHPVAVRSTRGVTLTEPGRLLVEAAESISRRRLSCAGTRSSPVSTCGWRPPPPTTSSRRPWPRPGSGSPWSRTSRSPRPL